MNRKNTSHSNFIAATEPPENITTEPLSPPPDDEDGDEDEEPSVTALSTQHNYLLPHYQCLRQKWG